MKIHSEVTKYVEEVFMRYQVARQEVDSMCCLTDTIEFIQHDVLKLIGMVHAFSQTLDEAGVPCFEAKDFAAGFKRAT